MHDYRYHLNMQMAGSITANIAAAKLSCRRETGFQPNQSHLLTLRQPQLREKRWCGSRFSPSAAATPHPPSAAAVFIRFWLCIVIQAWQTPPPMPTLLPCHRLRTGRILMAGCQHGRQPLAVEPIYHQSVTVIRRKRNRSWNWMRLKQEKQNLQRALPGA